MNFGSKAGESCYQPLPPRAILAGSGIPLLKHLATSLTLSQGSTDPVSAKRKKVMRCFDISCRHHGCRSTVVKGIATRSKDATRGSWHRNVHQCGTDAQTTILRGGHCFKVGGHSLLGDNSILIQFYVNIKHISTFTSNSILSPF